MKTVPLTIEEHLIIICEGVAPSVTPYGLNAPQFNDHKHRIGSGGVSTVVSVSGGIFLVIVEFNGEIGFVRLKKGGVDQGTLDNNYTTDPTPLSGSSLRAFGSIMFVILELLKLTTLKRAFFYGANAGLTQLYTAIFSSMRFNDTIEKCGWYAGIGRSKTSPVPEFFIEKK